MTVFVNARIRRPFSLALLCTCLAAAPLCAAEMDHAAMGHASHEMDAESLRVLRERVPSYALKTDAEINDSMVRMPGDYVWEPETAMVSADVGVLVLAHGAGPVGDQVMKDGVAPLTEKYPTAIGFGMAMMGSGHIQKAFDDLAAAGAKTVVVVPVVVTEYASVYRQWDYILGRLPEGAYLDVPQVKTSATVIMAPAMSDHRLMTELLLDHAREMSTDPAREVVILVGHGPTREDDNLNDTAIMNVHAQRLKDQGGFSEVKAINLQDDAPPLIRAANVATLRSWVEDADKAGKTPIVVGFLMSTRGIQGKIAEDLAGLDYKFQTKGITAHPNFTAWVRAIVQESTAGM